MARYRIREGNAFRLDDAGALAQGGDEIELGDDVAARFAYAIEALEPVQTSAPAPDAADSGSAA